MAATGGTAVATYQAFSSLLITGETAVKRGLEARVPSLYIQSFPSSPHCRQALTPPLTSQPPST